MDFRHRESHPPFPFLKSRITSTLCISTPIHIACGGAHIQIPCHPGEIIPLLRPREPWPPMPDFVASSSPSASKHPAFGPPVLGPLRAIAFYQRGPNAIAHRDEPTTHRPRATNGVPQAQQANPRPTSRFASNLHQRDPRSALFAGYDGGEASRRPVSASPNRYGGYGYPGNGAATPGGSGGLGTPVGGFRSATPNKK